MIQVYGQKEEYQVLTPPETAEDMLDHNGDMTLLPTLAVVHPILNGSWTAELEHPIDPEGRWKYIQEDNVIKMPSFNGDQLFRIKAKEKRDSGITASLEPIFYDAMDDCFLTDIRPTRKNGQQALDLMTAPNSKYTGESDITHVSTAYYEMKNLMEAINGDDENSFVNRWGGEILFDNYKVIINERVGGDYGVELRYGKNIPKDGMSEEIDVRDVITRIYPKAYNGYMMTDKGYVDSPLVNSYPTVKTAVISFDDVKMAADASEDDEENGVIICSTQSELDEALTQRCEEQYAAGLDKPKVTISANMVLLQNTEEYKEYQVLETVSLGDTIHCRNSRLGIVTDARVIEMEYDSIRKKTTSVVIGDFTYNYFNNVSSAVNRIDGAIRSDGTLIAEKIAGIINAVNASLRIQNSVAKKVKVRAVLFEDLDPDSDMYGALAIGTQGLEISDHRTADGRDWDWTTAITAKGGYANIFKFGTLIADLIHGGTLTLGGISDENGILQVLDGNGKVIGIWNSEGIQAKNANIEGKITADKGLIGGFTVTENGLTSNYRFGNNDPERLVQYQVQILKPNIDGLNAIVVRRRDDESSQLEQRIAVTYDGRIRAGNTEGIHIEIYQPLKNTKPRILFYNGTREIGRVEVSENKNDIIIHSNNDLHLSGDMIHMEGAISTDGLGGNTYDGNFKDADGTEFTVINGIIQAVSL